jgi:hypothetical protein
LCERILACLDPDHQFDDKIAMIHENLSQTIEDLSARMIAIRDSL